MFKKLLCVVISESRSAYYLGYYFYLVIIENDVEVLAVVIIGAIGNGTMTLTGEAKGNNDLGKYKGVCVCAYGGAQAGRGRLYL